MLPGFRIYFSGGKLISFFPYFPIAVCIYCPFVSNTSYTICFHQLYVSVGYAVLTDKDFLGHIKFDCDRKRLSVTYEGWLWRTKTFSLWVRYRLTVTYKDFLWCKKFDCDRKILTVTYKDFLWQIKVDYDGHKHMLFVPDKDCMLQAGCLWRTQNVLAKLHSPSLLVHSFYKTIVRSSSDIASYGHICVGTTICRCFAKGPDFETRWNGHPI